MQAFLNVFRKKNLLPTVVITVFHPVDRFVSNARPLD